MSFDTDLAGKLNDVLTEHLATKTGGGFVTGFHFVAEFIDEDGDEAWLYATLAGQTMSRTLGLIRWSDRLAEYEQRAYLEAADGDT